MVLELLRLLVDLPSLDQVVRRARHEVCLVALREDNNLQDTFAMSVVRLADLLSSLSVVHSNLLARSADADTIGSVADGTRVDVLASERVDDLALALERGAFVHENFSALSAREEPCHIFGCKCFRDA